MKKCLILVLTLALLLPLGAQASGLRCTAENP